MTADRTAQPSPADSDALRACLNLGLFFVVVSIAGQALVLEPHPGLWRDGSTLVVGRDYMNFWMYGRAAALPEPGLWYDLAAYHREQAAMLGADYPGQNWSYPPTVIPFAIPFAQLPYLASLALWSALGLAIFAATLRGQGADWRLTAALLASPAAVFCLISGQSSLVTAAATVAALALLDRRPLAAGVLIGLLTVKPQLGLLFPIMLLASGRWRVFLAAAATAIALATVATALFGVQVWVDFVQKGLPVQGEVLADPQLVATPFYVTVFMNVRGLDAPCGVAMGAQIVVTLAAAAAVWFAYRCRREADPQLLSALFVACSVAATPYMLSYDSLALAVMALTLLAAGKLDARGRLLAKLVFWLPLIQMSLGYFHVPGPALIAPAFAAYLTMRLGLWPAQARQVGPVAA